MLPIVCFSVIENMLYLFIAWTFICATSINMCKGFRVDPAGIREGTMSLDGTNIDTNSINWPEYRFYSIAARKYLSANTSASRVVRADSEDPSSSDVVWLLIDLPSGLRNIRHKSTRKYLCFNSRGRPILMATRLSSRCDIQLYASNETIVRIQLPVLNWTVGFCENGITYTMRRPRRSNCSITSLTPAWNYMHICKSLVPPRCTDCSPFCSPDCARFYSCNSAMSNMLSEEESRRMREAIQRKHKNFNGATTVFRNR